jgi:hypothetical protein
MVNGAREMNGLAGSMNGTIVTNITRRLVLNQYETKHIALRYSVVRWHSVLMCEQNANRELTD